MARTARSVVSGLERTGCTRREAGNIAAYLVGIRPVPSGWTAQELERLLFLWWLRRKGTWNP